MQGLACPETETGVMPGAADRFANNQSVGERSAIVGALGADCENLGPLARQQYRLLPDFAEELASVRQFVERNYEGEIVMLSSDEAPPVDRPNLSKDYLAGNAPEDWIPLRPGEFYRDNRIDLRLSATVEQLDVESHELTLLSGEALRFDRLLLAIGAEPVRPTIPGASPSDIFVLRSLADGRAIIERAKAAKRAVVLGASFIGLEVAASLRTRNIDVSVVAPEATPMERVLGREMGEFVRALHEEHGVVFHLGATATAVDEGTVRLSDGSTVTADFIVAGIGARPRVGLAEAAGLKVDRGVVVDAFLETTAPGIFAAGDIARCPIRYAARPSLGRRRTPGAGRGAQSHGRP